MPTPEYVRFDERGNRKYLTTDERQRYFAAIDHALAKSAAVGTSAPEVPLPRAFLAKLDDVPRVKDYQDDRSPGRNLDLRPHDRLAGYIHRDGCGGY